MPPEVCRRHARNRRRSTRRLAAASLALAAAFGVQAAPASIEDEAPPLWEVTFRSGRAMRAHRVVPADALGLRARIILVGGGEVLVPTREVLRLEELPPPPIRPRGRASVEAADAPPRAGGPGCRWVGSPRVQRWNALIAEAAGRHGLDADLVRVVLAMESGGDPDAVSSKGAVGLMQVLPRTAADYGVSGLTDPASNIEVGCRHLSRLIALQEGRLELALAAYNAGEGAVLRAGGVPPYTETRRYVREILACLERGPD